MTAPITAAVGAITPGRPARPVRFADPAQDAAYWARVDRHVDQAPPLTDEQLATIRLAIWGAGPRRAAA